MTQDPRKLALEVENREYIRFDVTGISHHGIRRLKIICEVLGQVTDDKERIALANYLNARFFKKYR